MSYGSAGQGAAGALACRQGIPIPPWARTEGEGAMKTMRVTDTDMAFELMTPEPASALLLFAGTVGPMLLRWRRSC